MSDETIPMAINTLTSEIGQMRTDLMTRMDRIQQTVLASRDDFAVIFGTTDQVRRANENTRSELAALANVVALMERQIQHLQADIRKLRGEAA